MKSPVLHPASLAAVALLVVNDHVLKQAWPGVVTGKLSDVAGMIFFPLLVVTLARGRGLVAACVATAIVFALVKTTAPANHLYRVTWGAMHWPLAALRAWYMHRPLPGLGLVSCVRDPSDVVATPFVLVAWWIGQTGSRRFRMIRSVMSMNTDMP